MYSFNRLHFRCKSFKLCLGVTYINCSYTLSFVCIESDFYTSSIEMT